MNDPSPQPADLTRWADLFRRAARLAWRMRDDPASPPRTLLSEFRDDSGHRRAVDTPFLAAHLGVPAAAPPRVDPAPLDERLWWSALGTDGGRDPMDLIEPAGPLTEWAGATSVEIWTETELCALHALWRLGRLLRRADLADRCVLAARWHVENIQPDNATHHPWAVHVFAIDAVRRGNAGSRLHAQTMLHNTMVALGRPDLFSAHILEDAADELTRHPGEVRRRNGPGL